MKALFIPMGERARWVDLEVSPNGTVLQALYKLIGCTTVQALYPSDPELTVIGDEEGLFHGWGINHAATGYLLDVLGPGGAFVGPAVILGVGPMDWRPFPEPLSGRLRLVLDEADRLPDDSKIEEVRIEEPMDLGPLAGGPVNRDWITVNEPPADKPVWLTTDAYHATDWPMQWVSSDRCQLVTLWRDGTMTVTLRAHAGDTWPPAIAVRPE